MNTFPIFWHDLTEEAQNALIEDGFIFDENMDDQAIAYIDQEENLE